MKWFLSAQRKCVALCCFQTVVQQTSIVQKFGNTRMTPSTLGGHEGKYTPNSSVPDLAQRYIKNTFMQYPKWRREGKYFYTCNWFSLLQVAFSFLQTPNSLIRYLSSRHLGANLEFSLVPKVGILKTPLVFSLGFANKKFNPLNPKLNSICYLLALLGAHHFLHVSRIRVKLLTFRLLMSYIYGAPILDVSRSHTTTQHSR